MRLLIAPEARWEFEAAERYYDRQMQGLSAQLREEVREALRRLQDWPLAFPVERGDIRRVTLARFPYKLLYAIEPDCIYVIADHLLRGTRTGQDMAFCRSVAAAWFVVASFAACAHATANTTVPLVIRGPVEYPASAVSAGEEGTGLVAVEVDISGRAVGAKISRSSGYRDLDAAALRSIAGWSFSPATKDGNPMAQQVVVPIRFQLDREATGASGLAEDASAVASVLLRVLGIVIWAVGFVWSLVLAKRKSTFWLWGLVRLWVLTYPVFVATDWSLAKRNLAVVSLGIALVCLGLSLAPWPLWT